MSPSQVLSVQGMASEAAMIVAGLVVVAAVTALTGYFVAQEFAYVTVDRSQLRSRAAAGDEGSRRALAITDRTSFMLSGAQLGITVTGLVVGYVAEPLIGNGLASLLSGTGLPSTVLAVGGAVVALGVATAVQMVYGELLPKNLAIARPEPLARRLALSTRIYLTGFGWVIRFFDGAANVLLRVVGIQPVHDVEEAATAKDLEAIIDASRRSGELPEELSVLLDRVLDFSDRTAREAMIPRPDVDTVPADEPLTNLLHRMADGHSFYPVIAQDDPGGEEVVGVLRLRDVLAHLDVDGPDVDGLDGGGLRAGDLARAALFVPDSLPLPRLLADLRERGEQLACVLDEFGGLAGIVSVEDVAEELVGEIGDEHHREQGVLPLGEDGWRVPGALSVPEVERLIGQDLPSGRYATVSGLVLDLLDRLPRVGDEVVLDLPTPRDGRDDDHPAPRLRMRVIAVHRRVPATVQLQWTGQGGPR